MERLRLSNSSIERYINSRRNQNGFASLLLLILTPFLLCLILVFFVLSTQIEIDSALQSTCRASLLNTQDATAKDLKRLLALNSISTALKIQEQTLYAALASALAAGNGPLIARLSHQLHQIRQSRVKLDQTQRTLITRMNFTLTHGLHEAQSALRSVFTDYKLRSQDLSLHSGFAVMSKLPIRIAVERVSMDIAPNYRTVNNFELKQLINLSWNYNSKLLDQFGSWLQMNKRFSGTCSATLTKKEDLWIARLIEAPSLLRH